MTPIEAHPWIGYLFIWLMGVGAGIGLYTRWLNWYVTKRGIDFVCVVRRRKP
jgi:hypothetical protein